MRLGCQGGLKEVARSRGGEGVLARRRVGALSLASPSSPGRRRRGEAKIVEALYNGVKLLLEAEAAAAASS